MPAPTPQDAASQDAVPSGGPTAGGPLTRRRFLTYVVAAPVLTVAASSVIAPGNAHAVVPSPPQPGDHFDLGDVMSIATKQNQDLFVLEVTPENRIIFRVPRAEVGQGITTALAIIIADEIDARLVDVDAPLEDARQDLGTAQSTGGSSSVRSLWDPVRSIAAEARARLVTAAAQRWNVSADSLTTRDTAVWAPDGRSATYGSLTEAAAQVDQPAVSTDPKPASEYKLIGTATPRIDARSIVTGAAKYALDVDVPDALPTVVIRPPTLKGKVQSYDASEALNMSGVVAVTELPTGVAVSAKTFHQALKARSAVDVTWGSGTVDGVSDEDIESRLTAAIPPMTPALPSTQKLDATFSFAFVNHAPMEVGSAVADVHSDSAEIWVASKSPTGAQSAVASAVGLSADQVTLHVIRAGGSFGRRIYHEPAVEAARVSKAIGHPVKLMWTRNDDMRHGRVRPRSHHQLRAVYTDLPAVPREVLSYEHRASCVELDLGSGTGQALIDAGYVSPTIGAAFFNISQVCPYNFGVVTESLNEVSYDMPTATWRSVYSAQARTAEEILVDEIGKAIGKNPVEMRSMFLKTEKARAVLDKVASEGNWGRAMLPGTAQGVALHAEYRSLAACLVEIDCRGSNPRVTKAVMALDVGRQINPSGVRAQAMGSVIDGISTVLLAGNHLDNGAFREGSFSDFKYARQADAPLTCDVHLVGGAGEPGGVGELCVPAAAGAVANAYARATGKKPRNFPINF
ncbi:MAG TPA: molybdopterin cofactor-binding domain-containing protein [Propionibacteriaceae bacterium]|jgi:isoquinoline 1-oxidoreductase subunit beta|nr:molybdopterin cofactor-binding domain-containing protein [Propionibacteriaceae bacterium]